VCTSSTFYPAARRQYADVGNTRAQITEELTHKIAVLHRHCDTEGRDPAQIRKTAIATQRSSPISSRFAHS
jgi:hypothetical protein